MRHSIQEEPFPEQEQTNCCGSEKTMSHIPVLIKSSRYGLMIRLHETMPFPELLDAVAEKFRQASAFFGNAKMAVTFQGRVLTNDQERRLVETIVANSSLEIACVVDECPKEAAYYEQALRLAEEKEEKCGLFYRGNLRSGQTLELEHSVVILGDVNPGASVISKGNVVILGACRGTVYAGASGCRDCVIAAVVMKPLSIRIADKAARSAIAKRKDSTEYAPEPKIAYIRDGHIHVENLVHQTLLEILGETEEPK